MARTSRRGARGLGCTSTDAKHVRMRSFSGGHGRRRSLHLHAGFRSNFRHARIGEPTNKFEVRQALAPSLRKVASSVYVHGASAAGAALAQAALVQHWCSSAAGWQVTPYGTPTMHCTMHATPRYAPDCETLLIGCG